MLKRRKDDCIVRAPRLSRLPCGKSEVWRGLVSGSPLVLVFALATASEPCGRPSKCFADALHPITAGLSRSFSDLSRTDLCSTCANLQPGPLAPGGGTPCLGFDAARNQMQRPYRRAQQQLSHPTTAPYSLQIFLESRPNNSVVYLQITS